MHIHLYQLFYLFRRDRSCSAMEAPPCSPLAGLDLCSTGAPGGSRGGAGQCLAGGVTWQEEWGLELHCTRVSWELGKIVIPFLGIPWGKTNKQTNNSNKTTTEITPQLKYNRRTSYKILNCHPLVSYSFRYLPASLSHTLHCYRYFILHVCNIRYL